jgi:hypothetical protein
MVNLFTHLLGILDHTILQNVLEKSKKSRETNHIAHDLIQPLF